MKILFLPNNIASVPAITAFAINKAEGVSAKCLTNHTHKYQSVNETVLVLPDRLISLKNPFKFLYAQWKFKKMLKKWIAWADVLHYIWGPAYEDGRDLRWAKDSGKLIFVEWVGSDLRDPDVLSTINKYYTGAFNNGYEYQKLEGGEHKKTVQRLFFAAGAIPIAGAEISLFLNKALFPEHITLMQRLCLNDFLPHYPDPQKTKPLIIHSPSAKIAKGSNVIIGVIEELKKDFDFEFKILHNISREEVLEIMKQADIFLDQIIIGGYGMAATEALAFGKPVLCYLMPELFEAGMPEDCPIVNTNPDNLKEQLIKLICNPQLRNDIGKQSRAYVEKHHDVEKIAKQLLQVYKHALEIKNEKNAKTA